MKKINALIILILFLSSNASFAQEEAKQLFKTEFPEIYEAELKNGRDLSDEEIAKYRFHYQKLKESAREVRDYKLGGITQENIQIFNFRELRNLERSEQINELEDILRQNKMNLKKYLSDKTQYGADSIECIEQSSILKTLYDAEDYQHAYPIWKKLYTYYPVSSRNIYLWGEKMLEDKIEATIKEAVAENQAGNVEEAKALLEERDQWTDTLLMMLDQRIKYYGDHSRQHGEGFIIGKKGIALYKYQRRERLEEAYGYLKESAVMQAEYPSMAQLQYFFFGSDLMYENEHIDAETVVEDYTLTQEILANYIERIQKLYEQRGGDQYLRAIEAAETVSSNITDKFTAGSYAECSVLVPTFEKKFEENKDNLEWMRKVYDILESRRGEDRDICRDSKLYENLTVRMYELEPSARAAYRLAQFYLRKEQYSQSAKYYAEAYTQEPDSMQKADYLYDAAVVESVRGNLADSRRLAMQALALNSQMGKAYLLKARLYVRGVTSCGEDAFEQSQVYWVAADMAIRARNLSPELAEEANGLLSTYRSRFPRREEAFMRSINEGDVVSIGCWIQRTTTARFIQ